MYVMINEPSIIFFLEETTAIGCLRYALMYLRKRRVN